MKKDKVILKTPTEGQVKCVSGQWVPLTSYLVEEFDCLEDAMQMIRQRNSPNCIIEERY